jgi:hypothetical protein
MGHSAQHYKQYNQVTALACCDSCAQMLMCLTGATQPSVHVAMVLQLPCFGSLAHCIGQQLLRNYINKQ